ncbi:MAG: (d)CMP kinase [Rhodospirillales bacterium]|jgi:cytidylate kinase|nr:(d)CMP kinase [Rhodospirillales bacterium]
MIVAVDGPSASGKGTLARRLAMALGLAYLDTGQIYRAVASKVLAAGKDPADPAAAVAAARALSADDLTRPDLRAEHVSQAASIVAAIPAVREALLGFQRSFANEPPADAEGVVLDGRDIGTVVCPEAEAKLFVTASPEVRAQRRHEELIARGADSIYARVLEDMKERDRRDESRAVAPSRPAPDALVLDTSSLDPDEVFETALAFIRQRCGL